MAEEKFRPLKKAMQESFRQIRQAVRAASLPEAEVVAGFVAQAEIMVSFPGFGEPGYPLFLAATGELAAKRRERDLEGCRRAVATLMALQKSCHEGRPTTGS